MPQFENSTKFEEVVDEACTDYATEEPRSAWAIAEYVADHYRLYTERKERQVEVQPSDEAQARIERRGLRYAATFQVRQEIYARSHTNWIERFAISGEGRNRLYQYLGPKEENYVRDIDPIERGEAERMGRELWTPRVWTRNAEWNTVRTAFRKFGMSVVIEHAKSIANDYRNHHPDNFQMMGERTNLLKSAADWERHTWIENKILVLDPSFKMCQAWPNNYAPDEAEYESLCARLKAVY